MIRWSYLVPRLVILGLILLAVWISADPLLRYAVINSTQAVTGSKVEVGQVKSSLLQGKVYIKDLAISDPRNPMQNMIQADVAYLQLDPRRLLHKELVIEHGHSTRVVFGAPRTESGELPNRKYPFEDLSSWIPAIVKDQAHEVSQNWLDEFQSIVSSQTEKNLELLQVSRQLNEKWPTVFARQKQKVQQIQDRIAKLKQIVEQPSVNPLRDPLRTVEKLAELRAEIDGLGQQLEASRREINVLARSAEEDRNRLFDAKNRDQEKLSQLVRLNQIDAKTMSQLLLGNQQADQLREVVNWIRWFQNSIPDPKTDFYPTRHRGTNIAFQGSQPRPNFLIKSLELDGEGTISGQHFDFAGMAKNLTTQPTLHDQPTTFELRAQGRHHLIVNSTIDRRKGKHADKMQIVCPDLDMPPQLLGDEKSVIVEMAESRMQADITIEIVDGELFGQLEFLHSDCAMVVNHMAEIAGGQDMALRMNQELARIQQFKTRATLGGTLESPTIQFSSDLGAKFAAGMNEIVKAKAEEEVAQYRAKLNRLFNEEMQKLDTMLQSNFDHLAKAINGDSTRVSALIEAIPRMKNWPNIRR